jgi:hypothetical protein
VKKLVEKAQMPQGQSRKRKKKKDCTQDAVIKTRNNTKYRSESGKRNTHKTDTISVNPPLTEALQK